VNVIEIAVPALRDRPEDILPLADSFLRRLAGEAGAPLRHLSESARTALLDHAWPGNVRELMNRIQRATLVATGDAITEPDLGLAPGRAGAWPTPPPAEPDDPERGRIEAALLDSGGLVSHAAAKLGLSRQALYRRME